MVNGELRVTCQGTNASVKCQDYCENVLKMHWKVHANDTRFPGCRIAQCCKKRLRMCLSY